MSLKSACDSEPGGRFCVEQKGKTYDIVLDVGRECWIWINAVERAVEFLWNFTSDGQAVDVCFEAVWRQKLGVDAFLGPLLGCWVRDSVMARHGVGYVRSC